jgi:hypothetical protein
MVLHLTVLQNNSVFCRLHVSSLSKDVQVLITSKHKYDYRSNRLYTFFETETTLQEKLWGPRPTSRGQSPQSHRKVQGSLTRQSLQDLWCHWERLVSSPLVHRQCHPTAAPYSLKYHVGVGQWVRQRSLFQKYTQSHPITISTTFWET